MERSVKVEGNVLTKSELTAHCRAMVKSALNAVYYLESSEFSRQSRYDEAEMWLMLVRSIEALREESAS